MAELLARFTRRAKAQRVICVLGMHRSGTSCLTGTLESWGLTLGDVWRQNKHNARGNRESQAIIDLHDAVLAHNGGSWSEPPNDVVWTREHRAALRRIIANYRKEESWGFKDPRTLLTLSGWLEELPTLEFIGIFRDPRAVASSLQARDPRSFANLDTGIALWMKYNERLLAIHAQRPFPVLCFDASAEGFAAQLEVVRGELKFSAPKGDPPFFAEELRHQAAQSSTPLPPDVAALYEQLKSIQVGT